MDWHKCRFLESCENLKPLVKRRFGREPSTSIAREIVSCLQQGRFFYEAAESSPLEIRPLQLFYGMMGFSKALILARHTRGLETLQHSHGVRDISQQNSRIEDLRVQIDSSGTFQAVNDVVAPLTKVSLAGLFQDRFTQSLPSATSAQIEGIELSLRDTLSRIPDLESLYRMTFHQEAAVTPLHFSADLNHPHHWRLYVTNHSKYDDCESLKEIVSIWRDRFPFLKRWALEGAQNREGECDLVFTNLDPADVDEFAETYSICDAVQFEAINRTLNYFSPERSLSPGAGYLFGGNSAVEPIGGTLHLSEYSLHYLALFLLSSLVRYRPHIWTSAVTSSPLPNQAADDRALSLIEKFLDVNREFVPSFVVAILNPNEDVYFGLIA